MSHRPTSQYVSTDAKSPKACGICDYSGLRFNRKDLVRQLEWRGNRLSWTGFYVGRPFVDVPNPQLRPPVLMPDPVPVKDPRLPQYFGQTWIEMSSPAWQYQGPVWQQWGRISQGIAAFIWPARQRQLENYYWGAG